MKVKVVKNFIDKQTKEFRKAKSVIEISEARYEELTTAGNYVEPADTEDAIDGAVQDDSELLEGTRKTTADILDDVLNGMTVPEIKDHAKEHEIDLNGARTKADIIEAIQATGVDESASEENDESVEAQDDSATTEDDSEQETKAFDEMSLAELKDYAKEHEIGLNGARTKATIIEAIQSAEK